MKYKLLISLLLLPIAAICQDSKIKTEKEVRSNSKGEITWVIVKDYDTSGFCTKRSVYKKDDELSSYSAYSKDSIGTKTDSGFNAEGKLTQIWWEDHNARGDMVRIRYCFAPFESINVEIHKTEYDENDNYVRVFRMDKDSVIHWRYTNEYNQENQEIHNISSYDNSLSEEHFMHYENGNLEKDSLYIFEDEIPSLSSIETNRYDMADNLISQEIYTAYLKENNTTFYFYEYDPKDRLITEEEMQNGVLQSKKVFHYEFY